jgi:hypothetical protein
LRERHDLIMDAGGKPAVAGIKALSRGLIARCNFNTILPNPLFPLPQRPLALAADQGDARRGFGLVTMGKGGPAIDADGHPQASLPATSSAPSSSTAPGTGSAPDGPQRPPRPR